MTFRRETFEASPDGLEVGDRVLVTTPFFHRYKDQETRILRFKDILDDNGCRIADVDLPGPTGDSFSIRYLTRL